MSVTCAFVSRTPRSSTIVNTGWSSPAAGTLNQRRVSLLTTVVKNDRSAPSYASKRSNDRGRDVDAGSVCRERAVLLHHDRLIAVGQTVSDALERAPGDEQLQIRPSSFTASRSSASSATLASMRAREKSSMSSPCTISYSPSAQVTGNEEMRPSATP